MEWCQKSVWEPVLRAVLRAFTRPPWDPSACFWNERLYFMGWVYPPRVPGRCPLMIAQREFEAFPSQPASGIDCIHCVLIATEAGSCSKVPCLLSCTSSGMSLISPNWTKLNTQITEPWCSKGRNLKKKKKVLVSLEQLEQHNNPLTWSLNCRSLPSWIWHIQVTTCPFSTDHWFL